MRGAFPSIALKRATKSGIVLLLLAGLSGASAQAQTSDDYPNRPIRVVVGFAAGGTADVAARVLADKLAASLGKQIVVENKPGAGSLLGMNDVLSRPRDGYNLSLCTYFDPVNTLLYRKAPYSLSDIAPISLIAKYDYALVASPNLPADNIPQLVQYAKTHPKEINYAHLGISSAQNLLSKQLEKVADVKLTGVPYKSASDSVRAVIAGEVQLSFSPAITVMPFYEVKSIKILAVTGAERSAAVPAIPTLKESGIPLVSYGWLGFCAGSGTPASIIKLLNERIVAAVNLPEYRSFILKSGSVPVSSTPAEFAAVIKESVDQAAPIIEEFGLKVD